MSDVELRDELMTLLVAGHETTASELAWGFVRLTRAPDVLARLVAEIDADDGDEYLTATIQETLRRRPVLPNTAPRLVKQPVNIGGWDYPTGVCVVANAYLVHHDPEIYPDPYAFRPERFLDEQPGTYTWIPFGGGRRRCLGASFALVEMKIVLRAILSRCEVRPGLRRPRGEPPPRDHGQPQAARVDGPARPARGARQRPPRGGGGGAGRDARPRTASTSPGGTPRGRTGPSSRPWPDCL